MPIAPGLDTRRGHSERTLCCTGSPPADRETRTRRTTFACSTCGTSTETSVCSDTHLRGDLPTMNRRRPQSARIAGVPSEDRSTIVGARANPCIPHDSRLLRHRPNIAILRRRTRWQVVVATRDRPPLSSGRSRAVGTADRPATRREALRDPLFAHLDAVRQSVRRPRERSPMKEFIDVKGHP